MSKGRCLGLVGGLGVGAAVHYYQKLSKAHEGRGRTLNLVMAHAETSRVFAYVEAGDRDGLAGITKANFNRIQGKKDQAGKDFENALASVSVPDTWAVEFRSEVGLARLAMSSRDWPGAKAHFLKALSAPTRPANEQPWAYYRLANVAQQLKDDSLLKWAVNGAITSDSFLANPTGAAVGVRAFLIKK